MVYNDQLRPLIIPAIAPPREGWAWPQRGWTGEDAMVAQLRTSLPQGLSTKHIGIEWTYTIICVCICIHILSYRTYIYRCNLSEADDYEHTAI